jgi:hypothetical protein
MPSPSALTWKERHRLIDGHKASPAEFISAAEELLAAGNLAEAADLFKRAGTREPLLALGQRAVEEGDFFLYSLARLYAGERPQADDLERLSQKAEEAGRLRCRSKALEALQKCQGIPLSQT